MKGLNYWDLKMKQHMNNSMNILQDISYWLNIKHCGKRMSVHLLQPYANNALIRHFKQQFKSSGHHAFKLFSNIKFMRLRTSEQHTRRLIALKSLEHFATIHKAVFHHSF